MTDESPYKYSFLFGKQIQKDYLFDLLIPALSLLLSQILKTAIMKNSNQRISLIICCLISVVLFNEACNQKQSAAGPAPAASDLLSENLKGNVTQVESDTYKIDSTGKTGPLDEKNIEKYDSAGYTSSYITMNGKDSLKSQTNFQHNASGFLLSVQTTGGKNEKKSSMIIEFDSSGKYNLAKSYDSTGKLDIFYTEIITNNYGQVTGANGHHADSTLKMTFTNDFDSVYYVGGVSKDSVGKLTYSSKMVLNEKKDPAKMEEITVTTDPKTKKDSTKNTTLTYTYENWDPHGNWTQQTSFDEKGKPVKIIKRIIVYKE
jgi:hypothetical protein